MANFTTEQFLPFTCDLKDGMGKPAEFEGDPIIASSDETVATATMNEGSKTEGKVHAGIPGNAAITISVDTDLNPEVTNHAIGVLDVTVDLDPRTGQRIFTINAGAPVDKGT